MDAQSFSNSFEGGHGVVKKIWKGVLYFRVLLRFYVTILKSLLRGYMRCPPPSSPRTTQTFFSTI
jgi:hypothetical protein